MYNVYPGYTLALLRTYTYIHTCTCIWLSLLQFSGFGYSVFRKQSLLMEIEPLQTMALSLYVLLLFRRRLSPLYHMTTITSHMTQRVVHDLLVLRGAIPTLLLLRATLRV